METSNNILEITPAIKQIEKFKDYLLSVTFYSGGPEVHFQSDSFMKLFNNYKMNYRECSKFPIELFEIIDGIKFFTLCQVEDFHATK